MARRQGYASAQIAMHWLIALLVIVQLVVAESMTTMFDAMEEGEPVASQVATGGWVHYWVGIAILALMVTRLAMRLVLGAPPHAPGSSPLQNAAATAVHAALYLVLLAAPISGLVAFYGLAEVGDLHALVRTALFVLVLLHVAGALFNQLVRKDGTLMRMMRPAA
jgi:cytochrome b561